MLVCRLQHFRPGTLSLAISENDDDQSVRLRQDYRNTEFLITTGQAHVPAVQMNAHMLSRCVAAGPGPARELDGQNVVFGRVLSGFETVSAVARVPTFKPQVQRCCEWEVS